MSLGEKLEKKRAVKKEEVEKVKKMSVQEKINTITTEMNVLTTKKEKITSLASSLKNNYASADVKLTDFKDKKEVLKEIFNENEDILKEDGVENFEEMLVENADEEEVKKYRQSGVRGPKTEKNKEEETGELYQSVKDIGELKTQLNEEVPELKLNFSARKINNQDINQRELSFQKIEEYLNFLDTELEKLKQKQAETLLETKEGKRDTIVKDAQENNLFNSTSIERPVGFNFGDKQIELASQFGEETVKNVYVGMLSERMKNNILSGIKYKAKNDYQQISEENALLNYPKLKQIVELKYDHKNYQDCENLKNKALNHLAELFKKDEKTRNSVNTFSQGTGRIKRYKGWNIESVLADQYLLHAGEMNDIGLRDVDGVRNYTRLVEAFEQDKLNLEQGKHSNNSDHIRSADYYRDEFDNYSKFFEYIINNTDKETNFTVDTKDESGLLNKFNKKEERDKIGFKSATAKDREKYLLSIPDSYIKKNVNFNTAWQKAEQAQKKWEETEKQIGALSKASVELKWTQIADKNFKEKNKDILEKINETDTLINNLELNLPATSNLADSEFADRKIKLISGLTSDSNSIEDIEHRELYKNISILLQKNREKAEKYTNELLEQNSKAVASLKNKTIVFGRDKKINALNNRQQIIEKCARLDNAILEKENLKSELSPEELVIIKEFIDKKNELDKQYRKDDQKRINFYQLHKNLKIDFKESDILHNQEMTAKELHPVLLNRLKELRSTRESVSDEIKTIKEKKIDLDKKSALAINNFKKQSGIKIAF
jgi:hypothetical protein